MLIYKTYKDQQLCDLLKQGDEAAYMEIYDRYGKLLYLFARRKLEDGPEAEDVVQEVYLSLWRRREEVTFETSLSAYLYRAVLNNILKIFSRRKVADKFLVHLEQYTCMSITSCVRLRPMPILTPISPMYMPQAWNNVVIATNHVLTTAYNIEVPLSYDQ